MQEPQDILTDIEQEVMSEPASTGSRFFNYLIDIVGFYLHCVSLALFVSGSLIEDDGLGGYLLMLVIFVSYYTLFEKFTNGKTPGKFLTGTRAVRSDGSPLTLNNALLRSVSRMVPFEPLSALGGCPWHDNWSNTKVIKD